MTKVADVLAQYTSDSQMNSYASNNGFNKYMAGIPQNVSMDGLTVGNIVLNWNKITLSNGLITLA